MAIGNAMATGRALRWALPVRRISSYLLTSVRAQRTDQVGLVTSTKAYKP